VDGVEKRHILWYYSFTKKKDKLPEVVSGLVVSGTGQFN
jgi:hypothetical protein